MSDRNALPVPDIDHLPLGSIASRLRALTAEQLQQVTEHEQAHAHRLPVLELLRHRAEELAAGAQPSGGDPSAPAVELPGSATGGGHASPRTAAQPTAPAFQGVPGEPRRPMSGRSPNAK